jgi:hypothetical protein
MWCVACWFFLATNLKKTHAHRSWWQMSKTSICWHWTLKNITMVESESRKLLLLLDDCPRKHDPSVEPPFSMMGVQKIRWPQTHTGFVVPTTALTDLWFGWQVLYSYYRGFIALAFVKILATHSFKTEWLFCKCVGWRLSSILMIGQKMSIKEDILWS